MQDNFEVQLDEKHHQQQQQPPIVISPIDPADEQSCPLNLNRKRASHVLNTNSNNTSEKSNFISAMILKIFYYLEVVISAALDLLLHVASNTQVKTIFRVTLGVFSEIFVHVVLGVCCILICIIVQVHESLTNYGRKFSTLENHNGKGKVDDNFPGRFSENGAALQACNVESVLPNLDIPKTTRQHHPQLQQRKFENASSASDFSMLNKFL